MDFECCSKPMKNIPIQDMLSLAGKIETFVCLNCGRFITVGQLNDKELNSLKEGKMDKDKIEQLKKIPLIETKIKRLRGTNLVLHQTIISDIRPVEYYEAIVDNKIEEE